MNAPHWFIALVSMVALPTCSVWVNPVDNPNTYSDTTGSHSSSGANNHGGKFAFKSASCFPFDDNKNWWHYTEAGGNTVFIEVTDTISDNNTLYFKVSFQEKRVDTTDDWFKRSGGSVMFAPSLVGSYDVFLPAEIDSVKGHFASGASGVDYTYYDSLVIGAAKFHRVLMLEYDMPILHGFTTIGFADSIGIVELKDSHERWPIDYLLDSCGVSGTVTRY